MSWHREKKVNKAGVKRWGACIKKKKKKNQRKTQKKRGERRGRGGGKKTRFA